jgi:hypothetical protein
VEGVKRRVSRRAKLREGARGRGQIVRPRQWTCSRRAGHRTLSLYDLRFGPARAHCPARLDQALQLPSRRPYFTKQGLDVHLGEWPMRTRAIAFSRRRTLLPLPVLRERVGVRVLQRTRGIRIRRRTLTPSLSHRNGRGGGRMLALRSARGATAAYKSESFGSGVTTRGRCTGPNAWRWPRNTAATFGVEAWTLALERAADAP